MEGTQEKKGKESKGKERTKGKEKIRNWFCDLDVFTTVKFGGAKSIFSIVKSDEERADIQKG